jgi:hypothetical protein
MAQERQWLNEEEKELDEDFDNEDFEEDQEDKTSGETSEKTETGRQGPTPFRFSDEEEEPESPDDSQSGDDGQDPNAYVDIKHNGQIHRVTREKAIELAQKGFDYDKKVGPHQNFAKLLEVDSELRQKVNDHVRSRMRGETTVQQQQQQQQQVQPPEDPFKDAEDDDPITVADARKALKTQADQIDARLNERLQELQQRSAPSPQPNQADLSPGDRLLLGRDPENYQSVRPYLHDYAQRYLTMAQLERVDNDPKALIEFYDWVKEQVLTSQQQQTSAQNRKKTSRDSSFRMQSGGGQPPRQTDEGEDVWKKSKKEFDELIQEFKGLK